MAGVIVGSYPQKHLTNPEVYMTQITILLGEYPLSIVKDVAHPYSGIVGKCKFLPSVAEIKEVAEQKLAELRGVIWAHEREQRRLAEARAEAEFEARLPSLEERERAAAEAQKVIEKLRLKSVADALK